MSRTRRARAPGVLAIFSALSAVAVTRAGCGPAAGPVVVGARPSAAPSITPLPVPTVHQAAESADDAPAATFGHNARGVVLPDRHVTPGAAFKDVGAAQICDLHYTQGVRQPRFNTKVLAFANYGISIRDRDVYEVDHLIPVSLGGTNDIENLWPQPYGGTGAERKDRLERQLRGLVCSHKLALRTAQRAIATNWWFAYERYMGLPIDPGSDGLEAWRPPTHSPGEVTNGAPCPREGAIGYTDPKHVRLKCVATSSGELLWQKRY
jgi:hypothetical protein